MHKFEVKSFGPITEGSVEFGDLTIFVGPQASGKSLLVQLYKAIQDSASIRNNLKKNGYDWLHGGDPRADYLALYFGGGMQSIWKDTTKITLDDKSIDFKKQVVNPPPGKLSAESVFLIPAQRVLVLQDGWPKPFMGYAAGDPYCLRNFSDTLRMLMAAGLGSGEAIFPQPRRLKTEMRRLVEEGIYVSGTLSLRVDGMRKQIVLVPQGSKYPLPYYAWSAGQREFTPLLLGLYWLMPSSKISKRKEIKTVIIEEPEMGLHPQAILSFCLLVFELLYRGYKVIISTHSPIFLDVAWMVRELKGHQEDIVLEEIGKVFGINLDIPMKDVLKNVIEKDFRTYYFGRNASDVYVRDISSLDPGSEDENVSGWGGLSGFSGRIADAVGRALEVGT